MPLRPLALRPVRVMSGLAAHAAYQQLRAAPEDATHLWRTPYLPPTSLPPLASSPPLSPPPPLRWQHSRPLPPRVRHPPAPCALPHLGRAHAPVPRPRPRAYVSYLRRTHPRCDTRPTLPHSQARPARRLVQEVDDLSRSTSLRPPSHPCPPVYPRTHAPRYAGASGTRPYLAAQRVAPRQAPPLLLGPAGTPGVLTDHSPTRLGLWRGPSPSARRESRQTGHRATLH